MTVQHRSVARRMKRQNGFTGPGGTLVGGGAGGGAGGGEGGLSGSGSSSADNGPSPSASNPGAGTSSPNNQVPSITPPDGSPTPSTPNSPNSTPAPNRPSPTSSSLPTIIENASSTSTDTSSATDSSTTSSSSSSSTSATTSSTSTSTVLLTAPAQIVTPSVGVPAHSTLVIGTSSATPSATASAAPSSGVKVGTVIGGIIGTLAGLAVIGIVASFILRRVRKRNHRDTIIGDEFRNSQFITGAPTGGSGIRGVNDNDILEPPSMTEHYHNFAPSIASGPGMAGHGTFHGGTAYDSGAANAGGYGAAGYGAAGYGAAGAISAGAMQERPRYTYGQQNDEEMDDVAHGVYSSQPQPQVSYNPEAYSSYAGYGSHATGTGYQEATREYQGQQHGGYDQHQNAPFDAHAGYGVAVADPGPPTSSGTAGAHPSGSRDPATLTGNRNENTRSVAVQDDDVYGGI